MQLVLLLFAIFRCVYLCQSTYEWLIISSLIRRIKVVHIFFSSFISMCDTILLMLYILRTMLFFFLFLNQNALHRRKYPLLYGYSFNRFIYNAQKDLRVWLSLVTLSPWGCDKLWSLIVRRCPFYLVLRCSRVSWTVGHYLFMIIHSWGFCFFLLLVIVFHLHKEEIISFPPPNFKIYLLFFLFFSNIAFSSHLISIFCIVFENFECFNFVLNYVCCWNV